MIALPVNILYSLIPTTEIGFEITFCVRYGHIAPETRGGRGFCMIYAIVGIPLCLSVLADIGAVLATIINKMIQQYRMVILPLLHKYNVIAQKKKCVYGKISLITKTSLTL